MLRAEREAPHGFLEAVIGLERARDALLVRLDEREAPVVGGDGLKYFLQAIKAIAVVSRALLFCGPQVDGDLRRLKTLKAGLRKVGDDDTKDGLEAFPVSIPHLLLSAGPIVLIGERQIVGHRANKGVA